MGEPTRSLWTAVGVSSCDPTQTGINDCSCGISTGLARKRDIPNDQDDLQATVSETSWVRIALISASKLFSCQVDKLPSSRCTPLGQHRRRREMRFRSSAVAESPELVWAVSSSIIIAQLRLIRSWVEPKVCLSCATFRSSV